MPQWGLMPVGALAGGLLGQNLGPRQAMWIGVIGELTACLPLLLSPLRTLRELPPSSADALEPAGDVVTTA